MRNRYWPVLLLLQGAALGQNAAQQTAPFNVSEKVKAISARYGAAKRYVMEGEMTIDGQKGSNPVVLLRKAKFTIASAEGGKSLLQMRSEGQDEYELISNGQKTWTLAPGKKQYTEEESASASDADDDEDDTSDEGDLTDHYARLIFPTLKDLFAKASAAGYYGTTPLKIEGNKGKWPTLRLELKIEGEDKPVVEVVFDPDTLAVGRMTYANVSVHDGELTFTRAIVRFDRLSISDVPDTLFTFEPPKNAKLVEVLQIPGQPPNLLGHSAPDFEVKTLDGEKIRLGDLKGQPVLLSFWASWCPPCRAELPVLEKLSGEYKSKGLHIFGVNDEGKSAAKKYSAKSALSFPTLDDEQQKVNRLYGIRVIPTVFLIDKDGKVVRFMRGGHDEAAFRDALKAVGL